jgi:hypothetical protein
MSIDEQIEELEKCRASYYKWWDDNPTSKIVKRQCREKIAELDEQIKTLKARRETVED